MTRIKNEDSWLCLGNLIFVPSVVSIGKYKTEAPDIKSSKGGHCDANAEDEDEDSVKVK